MAEDAFEAIVADLTENLVDEFDVIDLLTTLTARCVGVLDTAAAGIVLASPDGTLRVLASSSETMRIVELFELQADEGPCVDCYRTGRATVNHDLAGAHVPWPRFAAVALSAGFKATNVRRLATRQQATRDGAPRIPAAALRR